MIENSQQIVYIMIGVPGSGKSTQARNLVESTGIIHSTDDVISSYGDYNEIFKQINSSGDSSILSKAHNENLSNFKSSIINGVSPVIVDNTNLSAKDIKPYIQFAVDNKVPIENINLVKVGTGGLLAEELAARNTHGVKIDKIKSMMDKYNNVKNLSVQEILDTEIPKRVLYSGVILSQESRERLLSKMESITSKLPDWKIIAHHCTINLGKLKDKSLLGKKTYMLVTHVGLSDNALAVMVAGVDSKNDIPHITLAISPTGKPKDSNDIINWVGVKRFGLTGTIEEITD